MASIDKRERDGQTIYRVRWWAGGRQRQKTFRRSVDAKRFRAKIEHELNQGDYIDPDSPVTVAEYARQWVANRPHSPRTAERMASIVEKHIVNTKLGKRRLIAVLPSEVQAWAKDRGTVLAPSTLHNLATTLRGIFASAVLDGLCRISPAAQMTLPSNPRARVVPLTQGQVEELAEAMPPRWRAAVITQAGLGLRVGELLALRVADVNFLRYTVRIETQLPERTEGKRSKLKTGLSGERVLPLPDVVANALAEHLRQWPAAEDGTIFATEDGRPYHSHYYAHRLFPRVVARTSLPPDERSHALRHHYASVLLAGGESVVTVAARLGHTTAREVIRTYGHLMPGSEDKTRAVIDDAWKRGPNVGRPEATVL